MPVDVGNLGVKQRSKCLNPSDQTINGQILESGYKVYVAEDPEL